MLVDIEVSTTLRVHITQIVEFVDTFMISPLMLRGCISSAWRHIPSVFVKFCIHTYILIYIFMSKTTLIRLYCGLFWHDVREIRQTRCESNFYQSKQCSMMEYWNGSGRTKREAFCKRIFIYISILMCLLFNDIVYVSIYNILCY